MPNQTRNKPRFIEPDLFPQWAILKLNRRVLWDQFYEEVTKAEPSQSKVNFLKRAIVDKRKQLAYYNFKFN